MLRWSATSTTSADEKESLISSSCQDYGNSPIKKNSTTFWSAVYGCTSSAIGAGIITLPYVYKQVGMGLGVLLVVFCGCMSLEATRSQAKVVLKADELGFAKFTNGYLPKLPNVGKIEDIILICYGKVGATIYSWCYYTYIWLTAMIFMLYLSTMTMKMLDFAPALSSTGYLIVSTVAVSGMCWMRDLSKLAKIAALGVFACTIIAATMTIDSLSTIHARRTYNSENPNPNAVETESVTNIKVFNTPESPHKMRVRSSGMKNLLGTEEWKSFWEKYEKEPSGHELIVEQEESDNVYIEEAQYIHNADVAFYHIKMKKTPKLEDEKPFAQHWWSGFRGCRMGEECLVSVEGRVLARNNVYQRDLHDRMVEVDNPEKKVFVKAEWMVITSVDKYDKDAFAFQESDPRFFVTNSESSICELDNGKFLVRVSALKTSFTKVDCFALKDMSEGVFGSASELEDVFVEVLINESAGVIDMENVVINNYNAGLENWGVLKMDENTKERSYFSNLLFRNQYVAHVNADNIKMYSLRDWDDKKMEKIGKNFHPVEIGSLPENPTRVYRIAHPKETRGVKLISSLDNVENDYTIESDSAFSAPVVRKFVLDERFSDSMVPWRGVAPHTETTRFEIYKEYNQSSWMEIFLTYLNWIVEAANMVFFSFTFAFMIPALQKSMADGRQMIGAVSVTCVFCTVMYLWLGAIGYWAYGDAVTPRATDGMVSEYVNSTTHGLQSDWYGRITAAAIVTNASITIPLVLYSVFWLVEKKLVVIACCGRREEKKEPESGTSSFIEVDLCGDRRTSFETVVKKFPPIKNHESEISNTDIEISNTNTLPLWVSMIVRTVILGLSVVIITILPCFKEMVNLIGAFGSVTVQILVPMLTYRQLHKGEMSKVKMVIHALLLVFGLISSLYGTISALLALYKVGSKNIGLMLGLVEPPFFDPQCPVGHTVCSWKWFLNWQYFMG